jgi:hypothetical protein
MKQWIIRCLLFILSLGLATAQAKTPVTIPIEIGAGPSVQTFFGKLSEQQSMHYGLKLDLAAVINQEIIKKFKKKIPKKYRKLSKKIGEVRFKPSPIPLIPTTITISPSDSNPTYGAIWDTFGIGTGIGPIKLNIGLPIIYSYIGYMKGTEKESMHLLRPSLSAAASLNLQFSKSIGMTVGWRSYFMPPQPIGGAITDFSKDTKESIWHIGQGFLTLNFRIFKDLKI